MPCCKFEADGTPIVCKDCEKLKNNWSDFDENVDDTLPFVGVISSINVDFSHLDPKDVDTTLAFPGMSPAELKLQQEKDDDFGTLRKWLKMAKNGCGPTQQELHISTPALRHNWVCRKQFVFINDVLYYRWEDMLDSRFLLCVPASMKDDVFFFCHDSMWKGHPGREPTNQIVGRRFYWWGRTADSNLYVETCTQCQTGKYKKRKPKDKMRMYNAGYPGQRIHTDIVGPLTTSKSGNTVLLTIIDQFTKFFVAYPLPNQTGETIADTFVREYCTLFGIPDTLVSDNGKNFILGVYNEMVKRLQIHKQNITTYKPSSNGAIERAHLTLFNKLRCELMKSRDFKNWDKYVNFCTAAMRSTEHKSTGFSPNFLTFGKELNQPIDIIYGNSQEKSSTSISEYVKKLVEVMKTSYKMVRENITGSLLTNKMIADRSCFQVHHNIGDIVHVRDTKRLKRKLTAKLLPLYTGPFLVIKKLNDAVYILQDQKQILPVHHDKIVKLPVEIFQSGY